MLRLGDCTPRRGEPVSAEDSLSPVAPFRIVNIGNAEPVILSDYIEAIERAVGRAAHKRFLPMQPGDVTRTFANTTLLRQLTGYAPSTQIDAGIRSFVSWYREYFASAPHLV